MISGALSMSAPGKKAGVAEDDSSDVSPTIPLEPATVLDDESVELSPRDATVMITANTVMTTANAIRRRWAKSALERRPSGNWPSGNWPSGSGAYPRITLPGYGTICGSARQSSRRGKARPAFCDVSSARVSGVTLRKRATCSPTSTTKAGRLGRPRCGTGAR